MITPTEISDHAVSFAAWCFRLIMLVLAVAAIFFIVSSFAANATECQSAQGGKGYWSWRYVKPYDNKKCWYRGTSGMSKSQLHWPEAKPEKKMIDPPPAFPKRAEIKTVKPDEFNELDAMADADMFFDAKPMTLWPPVILPLLPFVPWQERINGSMQ